MPIFEIPPIPTNPTNGPKPQYPSPEREIGDTPKSREVTATKKVEDPSSHTSNQILDPRENPEHRGGIKGVKPETPESKPTPARNQPPSTPKK